MSTPLTTDVVIVGAGLSGIAAAYHLQDSCPGKEFLVLEGRGAMGGTWDLFRYPGIRSDSDMYTLGFSFNPWEDPKAIADGPAILQYIRDTARKFGIDRRIRYHHRVTDANWSDAGKRWELTIAPHPEVAAETIHCRFLFMCSGYYDYAQGHAPHFPGQETFHGPVIHPQHWDPDLDYTGKNVIVIGSGATAVTLVPELAKKAARVFMLQRSPTYIMNLPSEDVVANFFRKILPPKLAYRLSRWKNILFSLGFYQLSRKRPNLVRRLIRKGIVKELGKDYDLRHFDPAYDPWDQRLCLVPDSDLFLAIKAGKAEMVTDHIARFTEHGIRLQSGKELEADIIITATGLKVQLLGGMRLRIDGQEVHTGDMHCYRGVLFSDIPNFAVAIGYTNASWTLKCDLNCLFVTRLLNFMDAHGYTTCTPRFDAERFSSEPLLDFDAGYIKRAFDILPKQGSAAPWKVYQNYLKDNKALRKAPLDDPYLEYR